ncbi:carbonic anhydrase [Mycena maculata]|uniref:Carbonic anhydrase n=1 Tax=Mycena maculata TaxID=230809 RepID=A0AAD7NQZ5_9AGAR|nr:carbonic anhydrase [Mycena maculata]
MNAQRFIEANTKYATNFEPIEFSGPRGRGIMIVTCMDPRVHPYEQLGLQRGECGIVRNAAGSAKDALKSLVTANYQFGCKEFAVFHHSDCRARTFTTENIRETIKKAWPGRDDIAEIVDNMHWPTFTDVEASVKADVKFLVENPLVLPGTKISGWVYDDKTGKASVLNKHSTCDCLDQSPLDFPNRRRRSSRRPDARM